MSARLIMLNLVLRSVAKPALTTMRDVPQLRTRFERDARLFFNIPAGTETTMAVLPGRDSLPDMPAQWVKCGDPDPTRAALYLHGGAFVAGSPNTHRHLAAALSRAASATVLVPDYRLAPEHPFPAALEDAVCAFRHLLDQGYTAQNIALLGDSAGGGLVFALMLRLRDLGLPDPGCAVAFSPWADLRLTAPSLTRNAASDVLLPARRAPEVAGFYLDGASPKTPQASPVLGEFQDPPPALILASHHEILEDDAVALASALRAGGGDVRLELWRQVPHAWPIFTGLVPEADRAIEVTGRFIERCLGRARQRAAA